MNQAGLPTLTGVVAGAGVVVVMLAYIRLGGQRLVDRSRLGEEDLRGEQAMGLARAVLPWLLLVLFSALTNYGRLGLYPVLFTKLAMPLEIVPGRPERLRMLWQAYTWVLVATLMAIPFYRMKAAALGTAWRKTLRRAPRPAFAAGVYFAIAYVLNHSGKAPALVDGAVRWAAAPEGRNMVKVVADACAGVFHQAYAGVAAYLGLLGGFISGSETSSIVMLSKLHFETLAQVFPDATPERLLAISLLVAAVSGIGGGLASVISPAKLQNAAAVIDRIGMESQVIRATAVIAVIMVLAAALLTFVFLARI
jgi:lactate permease